MEMLVVFYVHSMIICLFYIFAFQFCLLSLLTTSLA